MILKGLKCIDDAIVIYLKLTQMTKDKTIRDVKLG